MVLWMCAAALGLIPLAVIARRKGASFLGWWLFGTLLFVLALPMAIIMKPQPHRGLSRRCPYCTEVVAIHAPVCPFCRSGLPPAEGAWEDGTWAQDPSHRHELRLFSDATAKWTGHVFDDGALSVEHLPSVSVRVGCEL